MPTRFSSPRKKSRWARGDFDTLRRSGAQRELRTRNLEIPRCAIAHLRSGPGGPSGNDGSFSLTILPFLPTNRLLAGRFRPAMRFATRGPSLPSFEGRACRHREFPGAQEGAFPQNSNFWKEDAMTKRSEAKYKIDRRMGQNIWGRPKSPVNRRE